MKFYKIGTIKELLDLLNTYETVLLQFSASWCGPCNNITPKIITYLDTVKTEKSAYIYLDLNKFKELSTLLKITSIPSFTIHNKKNNNFSDTLQSSNLQVIKNYLNNKLII
jgi:thioredoxin 1